MLQPVQERQDDAVRHGGGVDQLERSGKRRRLHGHEEQPDGPRELLRDLGSAAMVSRASPRRARRGR